MHGAIHRMTDAECNIICLYNYVMIHDLVCIMLQIHDLMCRYVCNTH